ncbi:MAG: AmmeMemoRadiSam system protein A, partial [Spirochaetota bacterium]
DAWVEAEDYTQDNQTVSIELDPALSAQANAARYYDRAQKARRRRDAIEDEILNLETRLERIETDAASLEDRATVDLEQLVAESSSSRRQTDVEVRIPGLQFESQGFSILVGRNARENDALLRRHVRGNDVWLHARDYPGGYVFVKSKRGKSLPLDVLLDAGNLAIHYSKAKTNGRADLYYTQVKFLRRAKDGPKGLVLPTQEKNLHVVTDEARLLTVARERIGSELTGTEPDYPPRRAELEIPGGAFVTLHLVTQAGRRLRGCIGLIESTRPLYDTVRDTAYSAAFRDPRFPPLSAEELGSVELEISVLSRLEAITDTRLIVPGTHGIMLEQGRRSGLLLPQVAAERGWDRATFLEQTSLKAGLPPGAWSNPDTLIRIFTAEVFDESSLRM